MLTDKDYILINKFIDRNLSKKEIVELKEQFNKNKEFAEEIKLQTDFDIALHTFVKGQKKNNKTKIVSINRFAPLGYVASIIFLITTTFFAYKYFETTTVKYTTEIVKIDIASLSGNKNNYDIAYLFYNSEELDSALIYFNLSLKNGNQIAYSKLAKGYIFYAKYNKTKQNNFLDSCITIFEELQPLFCNNKNSYNCEQCNLYLANSYLLKNNNKEANKYFYLLFKNGNKDIIRYMRDENFFLWFNWKYIK